ncbi:Thiol:disulfide interchange protein DsbA [Oligella sp. MSHR50489EDL]|uniref:thiol:disulfide interchange protein DsbA/DsbL n=1 Tax=Oligella sp. MSHR50489EDL TaxID=3139409 RepID=UPI003D816F72
MIKLSNKFLVTALLSASFATPAALAQQGRPYVTFPKPLTTDSGDKAEVLDFFSYTCSHCAAIAPMMSDWEKNLDDKAVMIHVPVAFNAAMEPTQKFYYAIEALGRLDLHLPLFDAIHKERQRIFTEDALVDWAVKQGIDKEAISSAMSSFGVNHKARNARKLTDSYGVQGTPSIGIDGRYLTSPSMTGTYESSIQQAQELLAKVLAEK